MAISELYSQSWKTIISPPAARHPASCLGPSSQLLQNCPITQLPLSVTSTRNSLLSGFLSFSPDHSHPDLIIYLHGSGGSKLDAMSLIQCIPKYNVAIAAFDFAGCGNSEKQYITYGRYQVDDVKIVLEEVRKKLNVGRVTIWGRSMGAVTAILFAAKYPDMVDGLVLDGPFKKLDDIVERAAQEVTNLPKTVINIFLYFIKKKVDFELGITQSVFDVNYFEAFQKINPSIAILFIYSNYDKLVPAQEIFDFYHSYKGSRKQTYEIYESHNQDRKESMFIEAVKWIRRTYYPNEYKTPRVALGDIQINLPMSFIAKSNKLSI